MGKTLIAGPWVGEFGWELMEWQGYVRAVRRNFDRCVVISYPSSEYLYEDCDFYAHDLNLEKSGGDFGRLSKDLIEECIRKCVTDLGLKNYTTFTPYDFRISGFLGRIDRLLRLRLLRMPSQDFLVFSEKIDPEKKCDLIFHFRDMKRRGGEHKNYPRKDADWVISEVQKRGYRAGCVGHPEMAYCPEAAVDLRSLDLKHAVSALSNSYLVVGGSSAPMHLACLCDKKVLVWGDLHATERYAELWNPFKTETIALTCENFNPSPESVVENIDKLMKDAK